MRTSVCSIGHRQHHFHATGPSYSLIRVVALLRLHSCAGREVASDLRDLCLALKSAQKLQQSAQCTIACAGAMERFVSSPKERAELVGGIAAECERAAQLDWAVELYMYAGQAGAALALINDQLSNALQPALSSPARGARPELADHICSLSGPTL